MNQENREKSLNKASFRLELQDHTLSIIGDIYFDNVVAAMEQGLSLMSPLKKATVDLSQITQCDSSSLALCSAWVKALRAQKKEIVFINLPPFMQDLVRVHGLDVVLPLGSFDGKINHHRG